MLLHDHGVKKFILSLRRSLVRIKWSIETAILLAIARFLIKFIPFRYWRSNLGKIDNEPIQFSKEAITSQTIVKARFVGKNVRRTAKKMPFEAVCLPQAMAGRWMLLRRGIANQIFIGAKKNGAANGLDFHAWLMHGDLCLTGHFDKDAFQAFGRKKIRKHNDLIL